MFPIANGVEYITTKVNRLGVTPRGTRPAQPVDYLTVVRVYPASEGVFVSLDPGTDPTVVVEAVRDAVDTNLGAAATTLSSE